MDIQVQAIDYHRNGIAGNGFHVVLFRWRDQGEQSDRNMVGIVFPERGQIAVLDADMVAAGEIQFGVNSWRGDHFEDVLQEACRKFDEEM